MTLLDNLRLSDLSSSEVEALRLYKLASENVDGHSGCFDLNRKLEYGQFPEEMGALGTSVSSLDSVFTRCPVLTNPQTVYRAIGLRSHYPLTLPGERFRNLSFWSTAVNQATAIDFLKADSDQAPGALLRLDLPIGLSAYNMETLSSAGGEENEILLPRGILWTVKAWCPFDKSKLLPHVAKKFSTVLEAHLEGSSSWRAR